jgi:hypothetical protein
MGPLELVIGTREGGLYPQIGGNSQKSGIFPAAPETAQEAINAMKFDA